MSGEKSKIYMPKCTWVKTTDFELRDKNKSGAMRHKLMLINDDGTAKSKETIAIERKKIHDAQDEKNNEYERAKFEKLGTTTQTSTTVLSRETQPVQYTSQLPEVKYEPLVLHLDLNTGNTGAIIGSSKTGKSTLLMHIYKQYYQRDVPLKIIPILFARNAHIEHYKQRDLIKIDRWCPEIIKGELKIQKYSENGHEFVNFIDDFVDLDRDPMLKDLILTFRNSKISSYICLQYAKLLSKSERTNVNNVMLFQQNTDEAAEASVECFLATHFKKLRIPRDQWVPYFHTVTRNHGFFHIHPATGDVRICKI
jgi:hypothetical protein